ncbi:hypothetical protein GCM10009585_19900 [Brevibacterium paucivorans]
MCALRNGPVAAHHNEPLGTRVQESRRLLPARVSGRGVGDNDLGRGGSSRAGSGAYALNNLARTPARGVRHNPNHT